MILSRRSRRLSVPLSSQTKPLILVSYAASCYFFPSRLSYPSVRRWLALENASHPITARISSALPRWDIRYFSCADITIFRMPSPDFLTGIVLRAPMMCERVFFFPKKIRGKKVSRIILSTPVNMSPVSQLMRCINIHSYWIECTTTE